MKAILKVLQAYISHSPHDAGELCRKGVCRRTARPTVMDPITTVASNLNPGLVLKNLLRHAAK